MVIVAAVDGSERDETVVREAARLARQFDTELHVVNVLNETAFIELERTNVSKTGKPISMDDVRATAAEVAEEAATAVETDFEAVGLVGEPATQLLNYAETHDAAYLVIGGRHRSPVGKFLFGSAAQKILLNADRPVVVSYPQAPSN